ncbi:hypothetical protein PRZ48_012741 [Zasmidium cellare]|uniref:DUF7918 domain-containing protein n=1 Tax=Zasmidium cellare TaxID=395010 RepID=A0ABR0E5P6_ZASCE|nr:hypothetical protein PRZ48_012741 [Zasmidium cellare]
MAVLDGLPGVEVTVQVDGIALKEYEDPDEEELAKTHVCYVESKSEKHFSISVKVKDDFKYKGDSISVLTTADGTDAAYDLYDSDDRDNEILGFTAGRTTTKFRFNDLETVSDGHMTTHEAAKVRSLGELKVQVHHTRQVRIEPGLGQYDHVETGIISEKALKGDSIARKRTSKAIVTYPDGQHNPVATFVFRYRSMQALKSMLIIPRTPTPPPLEERDFDTLTREELKELHRRAKEAKEQEDTKRKIKRERKDENPRPRKVSRPSNGDTQLELDDEGSFRESSTATLDREEPEIIELD